MFYCPPPILLWLLQVYDLISSASGQHSELQNPNVVSNHQSPCVRALVLDGSCNLERYTITLETPKSVTGGAVVFPSPPLGKCGLVWPVSTARCANRFTPILAAEASTMTTTTTRERCRLAQADSSRPLKNKRGDSVMKSREKIGSLISQFFNSFPWKLCR